MRSQQAGGPSHPPRTPEPNLQAAGVLSDRGWGPIKGALSLTPPLQHSGSSLHQLETGGSNPSTKQGQARGTPPGPQEGSSRSPRAHGAQGLLPHHTQTPQLSRQVPLELSSRLKETATRKQMRSQHLVCVCVRVTPGSLGGASSQLSRHSPWDVPQVEDRHRLIFKYRE